MAKDTRSYLIDLATLAGYPSDPQAFADDLIGQCWERAWGRLFATLSPDDQQALLTETRMCRSDRQIADLLAARFSLEAFSSVMDDELIRAMGRYLDNLAVHLAPERQEEVMAFFIRRGNHS